MFCFTMRSVFLAILTTDAIFVTSSSIRTISAASIAASEPILPIAIPMSALVSTGASLIPSPTNARRSFCFSAFKSASTCSTLPPGNSSACTSSIPSVCATVSAASLRSPVSMTVCLTPTCFISRIASFAPSLMVSEMTTAPSNTPLHAT